MSPHFYPRERIWKSWEERRTPEGHWASWEGPCLGEPPHLWFYNKLLLPPDLVSYELEFSHKTHSKQRLTTMRMPCLLVQSKQEWGTGTGTTPDLMCTWRRPRSSQLLLAESRVPGDLITVLEPWDWQVLQGSRHHRCSVSALNFLAPTLSLLSSDLEGHTIQFYPQREALFWYF